MVTLTIILKVQRNQYTALYTLYCMHGVVRHVVGISKMPVFLDDQAQSSYSSTKLAVSDYPNGHRNYVFTRKLILNVIVLVLWVIIHSLLRLIFY